MDFRKLGRLIFFLGLMLTVGSLITGQLVETEKELMGMTLATETGRFLSLLFWIGVGAFIVGLIIWMSARKE